MNPLLSVVIPTRNRRAEIEETLHSLRVQTLAPEMFEVVVAIDGSEDDTVEMLARFPAPFVLTSLPRRHSGRAAAVNSGVRVARGEILVILDDDIAASNTLLDTFARHLTAHPDHAVVGAAPIALPADAPAVVRFVGTKMNNHLLRLQEPNFTFAEQDFYSGNFAIRRDLLLKVGTYDEDFTLYGNEDCELARRLILAGVPIVYLPSAVGHQRYTKDFVRLARDTYQLGRTTVLFSRKHPEITPRLRVESPPWFSRRMRAVMTGLVAFPALTASLLEGAFVVLGWLDRACPQLLVPRYKSVLDVLYWVGVKEEQRRGGIRDDRV